MRPYDIFDLVAKALVEAEFQSSIVPAKSEATARKIADIFTCRPGLFQFEKLLAIFNGSVVGYIVRCRGPSALR